MSTIDGRWKLVAKTPMGAQESTADLKADGGALTGTVSAQGNTLPIKDGKIDGDTISYAVEVTTPMPMTLEMTATIEGANLSGKMKAGNFGSFDVTGTKA